MERAAEAVQIRAPVTEAEFLAAPSRARETREYHVTFDGRFWNVETSDGISLDAARDKDLAIRLAILAARADQGDGFEASVCVQQQDGTSVLAWSS